MAVDACGCRSLPQESARPLPAPGPAPADPLSALLRLACACCLPACLPSCLPARPGDKMPPAPRSRGRPRALPSRDSPAAPPLGSRDGNGVGRGAGGRGPRCSQSAPPTAPSPRGPFLLSWPPGSKPPPEPRAPPQTIITSPSPWPYLCHPSAPHPGTPGPDRQTPGAGSQYADTQTHRERQRDRVGGLLDTRDGRDGEGQKDSPSVCVVCVCCVCCVCFVCVVCVMCVV